MAIYWRGKGLLVLSGQLWKVRNYVHFLSISFLDNLLVTLGLQSEALSLPFKSCRCPLHFTYISGFHSGVQTSKCLHWNCDYKHLHSLLYLWFVGVRFFTAYRPFFTLFSFFTLLFFVWWKEKHFPLFYGFHAQCWLRYWVKPQQSD